jgi:hypothetical protein
MKYYKNNYKHAAGLIRTEIVSPISVTRDRLFESRLAKGR